MSPRNNTFKVIRKVEIIINRESERALFITISVISEAFEQISLHFEDVRSKIRRNFVFLFFNSFLFTEFSF